MIESQFRDWIRGQVRALDERLKAVEAREAQPAARRISVPFRDDGIALAEEMLVEARAGGIVAFGIACVSVDGVVSTGYESADHAVLIGALEALRMRLLDEVTGRPKWTANANAENAGARSPS